MNPTLRIPCRELLCSLAFVTWLALPASALQVTDMNLAVTDLGGSFHYDVTITNNGPVDLTLVTITDAPPGDSLIDASLIGPSGFLTFYDAGPPGLINFLEDTSLFLSGGTVTGFSFESAFGPASGYFTTFEVLDVDGLLTSGLATNLGGGSTAVPDATSTLVLMLLGLAALAVAAKRQALFSESAPRAVAN